jgi:hypothetical protein
MVRPSRGLRQNEVVLWNEFDFGGKLSAPGKFLSVSWTIRVVKIG